MFRARVRVRVRIRDRVRVNPNKGNLAGGIFPEEFTGRI